MKLLPNIIFNKNVKKECLQTSPYGANCAIKIALRIILVNPSKHREHQV